MSSKDVDGLIQRKRFDCMALAGGSRCFEERIVDCFFGRLHYGEE